MAFVNSPLAVAGPKTGPAVSSRVAQRTTVRMGDPSRPAVPFLPTPTNYPPTTAGWKGFDPLGFANVFDPKFLQEAEIKHGRICMLAALGWVFPEFYHLPGEVFSATNPLAAITKIPTFGWVQIFLGIAILEAKSWHHVYMDEGEPGNYGFDPLGLSKNSTAAAEYADKELENGRLAMIAMGGFIHQALLTNKGAIAQIQAGEWFPSTFPLN
eukprot:CAMPEP_0198329342 /NCGR_PEP_ID=MMETSP1450-20131203/16117_1 /TAXON_ID=753684 ORGANISM="Madagascaria erythrocladiodes, Strain CCMP3234" /NCGR_SAMPLE_ID=MMETSP1450 /ASSEMBLY_ACC=CAM_ASM_001115 /LENGTH=211 /DNA_ID=CAMNT_0044033557 /DNA_START=55 /DNA_END=690 /DNA_ORIENTATION=+